MKTLPLKSIFILLAAITLQTSCNNTQPKQEALTTKDTVQQKVIKGTLQQKQPNEHKLSLKEIETLLEGTWVPADGDTVAYKQTYKTNTIYTYYKHGSLYNKEPQIDKYFLSFECPPDSMIDGGRSNEGFNRNYTIRCICYISLEEDSLTRKVRLCMAILKISKDSLCINDGEQNFTSVRVK